jgi:hypothetical protein
MTAFERRDCAYGRCLRSICRPAVDSYHSRPTPRLSLRKTVHPTSTSGAVTYSKVRNACPQALAAFNCSRAAWSKFNSVAATNSRS